MDTGLITIAKLTNGNIKLIVRKDNEIELTQVELTITEAEGLIEALQKQVYNLENEIIH